MSVFGWLKKPMSPTKVVWGIIDAGFARILQYELRIVQGCDGGVPYYGLKVVKAPTPIDLDGDGKPDPPKP